MSLFRGVPHLLGDLLYMPQRSQPRHCINQPGGTMASLCQTSGQQFKNHPTMAPEQGFATPPACLPSRLMCVCWGGGGGRVPSGLYPCTWKRDAKDAPEWGGRAPQPLPMPPPLPSVKEDGPDGCTSQAQPRQLHHSAVAGPVQL